MKYKNENVHEPGLSDREAVRRLLVQNLETCHKMFHSTVFAYRCRIVDHYWHKSQYNHDAHTKVYVAKTDETYEILWRPSDRLELIAAIRHWRDMYRQAKRLYRDNVLPGRKRTKQEAEAFRELIRLGQEIENG